MKRALPRCCPGAGRCVAAPLAFTGSAAQAAAGPTVTNGCITQRPGAGHDRAGQDLLHAVQAGRRRAPPPGADGLPQPRLGRLAAPPTRRASGSFLDAGYGVLSFDQRGFGESGGKAHVENPDLEGHDVRALVDLVSKLAWVQAGRPGRPAARRDRRQLRRRLPVPRRLRGAPRHAASRSSTRSPPRSPGTTSAEPRPAGRRPHRVGRRPQRRGAAHRRPPAEVYKALAEGAATGSWPDGSIPGTETWTRSSRRTAQLARRAGPRLDIPVLFGQGTTDTLFPLHQGLHELARRRSPRGPASTASSSATTAATCCPRVFPPGVRVSSDPCSKKLAGGDFATCRCASSTRSSRASAPA